MRRPIAQMSNGELLQHLLGEGAELSSTEQPDSLKSFFSCSSGMLQWKGAVVRELVRRWLQEEMEGRNLLSDPAAVKSYLGSSLAKREHETFMVLFLDAQNRLIAAEELFRGTLTQTAVYPREVLKAALLHNAAGVILAHNHPSGAARPSAADRQLTETLQKALALVDISVLDHFIVAGQEVLSFAERGWL